MIDRKKYRNLINKALSRNPIVGLLGARQVGKTTLAREFVERDSVNYFDLEDPAVAGLMENPMTALQSLKGLIVIDEAQLLDDEKLESQFKVRELPYTEAIHAGVIRPEVIEGERERLGVMFPMYYECEFFNSATTWYPTKYLEEFDDEYGEDM